MTKLTFGIIEPVEPFLRIDAERGKRRLASRLTPNDGADKIDCIHI
jgi:hypothetical protein